MASAGRILIMPKGNYDSSATYEMLDLVKHNGTSWLAKKTAKGIEPSEANNEYWHDLFDKPLNSISGELTVNDFGVLGANNVYTSLSAKKNGNNTRFIRIINQLYLEDNSNSIQFVEIKDGKEEAHNLFGEHNIDYLKQLLGLA